MFSSSVKMPGDLITYIGSTMVTFSEREFEQLQCMNMQVESFFESQLMDAYVPFEIHCGTCAAKLASQQQSGGDTHTW